MTRHELPEGYVMPYIHLNGTAAETFNDNYETAHAKLQEAYDAIRQLVPNMRDYYPYENARDVYDKAVEQHRQRLARVEQCMQEIQAEADHVFFVAERQRAAKRA